MVLAHMVHIDRIAVICDFAETYHIYDMWTLPARTAATLACGLGPNSRIMLKLAGVEISPPFSLLVAMLIDEVRAFRYMWADESAGEPAFITDVMLGNREPARNNSAVATYESGAAFEEARAAIIERIKRNNGG